MAAVIIPIIISLAASATQSLITKAINGTPQIGRLGQDDFHTLESAYDVPLPKCWGVERLSANITWQSRVTENHYDVTTGLPSIFGFGAFNQTQRFYYYTQDVEYTFALGPAKAFVKIWLGDKVIYDQSSAIDDGTSSTFGNGLADGFLSLIGTSVAPQDRLFDSFELFLGTETQQPSNIVSAVEGFGTVPADRGIVKLVIKRLNLTKLGANSLPASSAIIQFADYVGVPVAGTPIDAIASSSSKGGDNPPNTSFSNVTNTTATITRNGSGPLAPDPDPTVTWSGFAAPTLPAGATITGIYPKATISRTVELGAVTVRVAGQTLYNSGGLPGDPLYPDLPSTTYYGSSIGTSLSDLSGKTATFENDSTLSRTATDIANVEFIGFEVRYTTNNIPPTGTTLGAILADLFQSCDFTTDEYSIVTEIATIPVKGFKTEQKAVRDVIRELMDIYPFDGYEGDGRMNIVHRAGVTSATVDEQDLVLSGEGENGYRVSEPITQENEVPMKVDIHYADIDRDFQDNVQHSKRIIEPSPTMESITVRSISTNVVMNANEAAQAAERNLWEPWSTRRAYSYQLMPKHLLLDASDKVQVNYKNQSLVQRIKQANLGSGFGIQIAGVSHDSDVFTSSAVGASNGGTFPVPLPSSADPGLVNEPVIFEPPASLVPSGAAGALIIQVSGADPDYGGCEVFLSLDGTTYQSLGDMAQGVTGFLLADFPIGSDPDTSNVMSVDLTECSGFLPSRSQGSADAFADLTYIGVSSSPVVRNFEFVCPTAATESTSGVFELSDYIRRGVYTSGIIDHPTGSRFADLNGSLRINLSSAWVGITLYFKLAAYNLDHIHPAHQQADDLSDCVVYPYVPLGVSLSAIVGEIPSGPINGSNTSFALSSIPASAASLMLFWNGLVLRQGTDYTISGSSVSLTNAPQGIVGDKVADWLYAIYRTDGSSSLYDSGVTPTGTIDGLNADFVMPHAPNPTDSLILFLNGALQLETTDYTLASATITETTPPIAASGSDPADWLLAWSRVDGISANYSYAEVPTGTIDGSNAAFTLTNTPRPITAMLLFQNRIFLRPNIDYTVAGTTLTLTVPPETGASLVAFYPY
jgi:hypothetical protein